jgi:CBS domain-containing protein
MSIKQFLSGKNLVSCAPTATIQDVAKLMRDEDVGSVVICDENDMPLGVITDRDIAIRCVSEDKNFSQCRAQDFMSRPANCLSEDVGLHEIVETMRDKQIRRVVITDADGTPVGVISHGDVIRLMANELRELTEGTAPKHDKLGKHIERAAS